MSRGQVIAPGFINMMSGEWGLFADGRSQSDIRQGVTLEIFGEGESMGPLNDAMRAEYEKQEVDIHYDVTWHTLAEGLDTLAQPRHLHRTSLRSSERRLHGSTCWAAPTARRRRRNSTRCAR